uniref:Uncharacterized protein LOC105035487 n=1 Tax=Elaeis guineensis var. tenera TaxID=51953 RepID=A0A6I9QGW9_ELAGV|nr:uncharacterized protein LOC105035487 [Elaeis guineensis]
MEQSLSSLILTKPTRRWYCGTEVVLRHGGLCGRRRRGEGEAGEEEWWEAGQGLGEVVEGSRGGWEFGEAIGGSGRPMGSGRWSGSVVGENGDRRWGEEGHDGVRRGRRRGVRSDKERGGEGKERSDGGTPALRGSGSLGMRGLQRKGEAGQCEARGRRLGAPAVRPELGIRERRRGGVRLVVDGGMKIEGGDG